MCIYAKTYLCNIRGSTFRDNNFSDFSSFYFKGPVEKVAIVEEKLHGIEIKDLENSI